MQLGEVEVRLRFIPVTIAATDDANLSSQAPYRMQSFLQFEFESTSQLRGYDATFGMTATDHRGETVRSTIGDYDLFSTILGLTPVQISQARHKKLFLSTPTWLPVIT